MVDKRTTIARVRSIEEVLDCTNVGTSDARSPPTTAERTIEQLRERTHSRHRLVMQKRCLEEQPISCAIAGTKLYTVEVAA